MKRQSSAPASNRVYFPQRQRHVLSPHSSLNDLLTASKSLDPDKNVYRRTRGSNFSPSRPKSSPARPINLNGKSKSTGELNERSFSFETCVTQSFCADAHGLDDEFNRNIRKSPWLVANNVVEATPEYDEYSDYWLNRSSRSSTAPTIRTGNIFRSNSIGTSSTLPIIRGSSNETSRSRSTSPSHSPLSESSLLHNSHLKSNQKQIARFSSGLGDIYSNDNAMNAYKAKKLNSQSLQDTSQLRILFLNRTNRDLVICWVGFDHTLHHYRQLKPSRSTTIMGGIGSINTSSSYLDTRVKGGMHKEQSYLGHSFVIGTRSTVQKDETEAHIDHEYDDSDHELQSNQGCWNPFQKREIVDDDILKIDKSKIGKIIAAYRPKRLTVNDEECKEETCLHIVTITEELAFMPQEREKQKQRFFRSSFGSKEDIVSSEPQIMYHLTATQCKLDDTPLDTSNKEYEEMNLGGWRVLCEKELFSTLPKNTSIFRPMGRSSKKGRKKDKERTRSEDETLLIRVKHRIELDLIAAAKKLPTNACEFLKETTPVWINRSQMYGPRVAPIRGVGMCYHPGKEWLSKNGMSEKKSGGVELYEAGKYLDDCDLWHGLGGVMLHEFSHAYHAKCIKNGYDNQEIIDCYNAAMEEELYDCVRVHNCQGNCDERRAYAATNPMEYFAELSAAFLGGTGSEKDLEFNKWFPFNRKQIKEHDPRAYKLLKRVWGVKDDDAKLDLSKQ